jgi:NADH-quinone oxidoreductase subunit M
MDQMGGLLQRLPFIGAVSVMAMFAGCGLPGFANFAGEALVLFGSWEAHQLVTILAVWGALIIAAVYALRAVRAIWHGPLPTRWNEVPDATSLWTRLPFALLLAGLLAFGCFPRLLTDKIKPVAEDIVKRANAPVPAAMAAATHSQP